MQTLSRVYCILVLIFSCYVSLIQSKITFKLDEANFTLTFAWNFKSNLALTENFILEVLKDKSHFFMSAFKI